MTLKIAIISDATSWMNEFIPRLVERLEGDGHSVEWGHAADRSPTDVCFFLSFGQIVPPELLKLSRTNLVVHGSALPEGKGWSPWSWQILEGRNRLSLTLCEASQRVDSGQIYGQLEVQLGGDELIDEWQAKQAAATIDLCMDFMRAYPDVLHTGRSQEGHESFYPRRGPEDSRLDINRTLRDQFNLLRIVDNDRYPAYFEISGHKYLLRVTKATPD